MTTKHKRPGLNDLCRQVRADGSIGDTLYLVEWVGERGYCVIREAGNPRSGGTDFDLSLLKKVERT